MQLLCLPRPHSLQVRDGHLTKLRINLLDLVYILRQFHQLTHNDILLFLGLPLLLIPGSHLFLGVEFLLKFAPLLYFLVYVDQTGTCALNVFVNMRLFLVKLVQLLLLSSQLISRVFNLLSKPGRLVLSARRTKKLVHHF
jgi:hypothetical protein